jgi:ATP-binding cassette subfamily F protein 2
MSKSRGAPKKTRGKPTKAPAASTSASAADPVDDIDVENAENAEAEEASPLSTAAPSPAPSTDSARAVKGKASDAVNARSTTGVLTSHPKSRDIQAISFSLTFFGVRLLEDTTLELNYGRRYGLVGLNGCGKSTLMSSISERDLKIPDHIDIFHLRKEIEPSDKTALEAVLEVDSERARLEKELDRIMEEDGGDSDLLQEIYDRLEGLDAATAEKRAAELLNGLGFTPAMQKKPTKSFSGGWRMRIALARAIFVGPTMLLLDQPSNHLDMESTTWLEEELKKFNKILLIISHSQDFLNGVCTNIIHFHEKKLKYYTGNYDQFCKTRAELEENQMKRFASEQAQIADMKDYIARFGHGSAKLARQAQSKEKVLSKMVAGGLTERVVRDKTLSFYFPLCGKLPPPVMMVQHVAFSYPDGNVIYDDIDFGIDLESRIALVGPNGAGKSTLMNILAGDLQPTSGMVRTHSHLRIARFHQHLTAQLNYEMTPIEFIQSKFPEELNDLEKARSAIGRYGLTGKHQTMPMKFLSEGQCCRVLFSWLCGSSPHLLLFDEPTNALDFETIDSLAEAINDFEGGLILISHDFRLINQVAKEIWVCEKKKVTKWPGDIISYKDHLRTQIRKSLKSLE